MKFIIKWDAGYGPSYETVETETKQEAKELAYESWKEEAENNAVYGIECEWTQESAEDFGVE